ncbi:MAG: hypothetical protein CL885_05030 [Dehalococcoidia bacterium]|nr:hypothetical protein [Dehalococcoidia bacterium]
MILLYLITPFLGLLRNYIKYKQLKIFVFLRTPLLYFFITKLFQTNTIWKTMMFERWFFLIYKSLLSLYNDDYNKKKEKYIKKYGLKYNI